MSRLGTSFHHSPSILVSSTVAVIVSVVIGCGWIRYPTTGTDDIQYFPAGPEFKLSREEAALRAEQANRRLRKDSAGNLQD